MAISKRLRYEVPRRDGYTCRYCGAKAPDVPMTVDAVLPAALGGSHKDPSNLAAACRDCNSGKSSSHPDPPLVTDVPEEALRWGRAINLVRQRRLSDLQARRAYRWQAWALWCASARRPGLSPERITTDPVWLSVIDECMVINLSLEVLQEWIEEAVDPWTAKPWQYGDRLYRIARKGLRELCESAYAIAMAEDIASGNAAGD